MLRITVLQLLINLFKECCALVGLNHLHKMQCQERISFAMYKPGIRFARNKQGLQQVLRKKLKTKGRENSTQVGEINTRTNWRKF
jgi:hypothetical protein